MTALFFGNVLIYCRVEYKVTFLIKQWTFKDDHPYFSTNNTQFLIRMSIVCMFVRPIVPVQHDQNRQECFKGALHRLQGIYFRLIMIFFCRLIPNTFGVIMNVIAAFLFGLFRVSTFAILILSMPIFICENMECIIMHILHSCVIHLVGLFI